MKAALLALLGLRSTRDDEAINAIRKAWREFRIVWERGAWRAYWPDDDKEPVTRKTPVTGKTPDELADALYAAWVATGSTR